MYLTRINIYNVRSLGFTQWRIPFDEAAGWHVIIGDNGSGKSTFLRATALALVGPTEAAALRQDWNDWLRFDQRVGSISIGVRRAKEVDKFSGSGNTPKTDNLGVRLLLTRISKSEDIKLVAGRKAERHIWGGKSGWFSASYGPFRRFTGGDRDYDRIFYSNPRLAPHLSVFGESIALTECLQWLQDLRFKELEKHPEGHLLNSIKAFVNQEGFLPHQAQLHEVSSKGVIFVDGNGCQIAVEDLSDGYRSVLSMTFELIRQLSRTYGPEHVFDKDDPTQVSAPGVVLIDEVDAHLHPAWQRRIGLWFRQHFPKIQFIVTTHSPLICQAADVGTVFRLPKPGSNERGAMVTGVELDRLLYGNVLDAYSTELFGSGITRSEASMQRLQRLAELNRKELKEQLSAKEKTEQQELRASQPTAAHTLPDNTD